VRREKARIFRAAASFYRQAPWRFVSERKTIKVKSQQLEGGPWYAMVLGGTAKVKGLILCDDRKSRILLDRGLYQAVADRLQDITVHFGDRKLLHPDDLAVAKRYGFEGDGPKADPMAFRTERGRKFRTPKAWELELLEACLRVIPDSLKRAEDHQPNMLESAVTGLTGEMTQDLSWVPRERLRTERPEATPSEGSPMTEKSASLEDEGTCGQDVPTTDFFQHRDVRDDSDLEWLVNDLIYTLERGDFLRWEAVVCQELGLALTERQRQMVSDLLSFGDETDEERILYIDGIPRPGQLWYEIVRKIASHLLVSQYKTSEIHYAVTTDGWKDLVAALERHGGGLSLPEGVERPIEVVPAELRHKLWLQTCLGHLGGLGQDSEMTLRDPEEHFRIEEFIDCLREHKESIEFLDLTPEKLLKVLILPPQDEPIFVEMMTEQLGLSSMQDRIAERL
jgi:hypothetical protein